MYHSQHWAFRANIVTSTGVSSHFALFGRGMNLGIDLILLHDFEKAKNIQAHSTQLKLIHENIRENTREFTRQQHGE